MPQAKHFLIHFVPSLVYIYFDPDQNNKFLSDFIRFYHTNLQYDRKKTNLILSPVFSNFAKNSNELYVSLSVLFCNFICL